MYTSTHLRQNTLKTVPCSYSVTYPHRGQIRECTPPPTGINISYIYYYSNRHENLVLVKGDACDVESFAAALDGKDAVLSSLGVYANIFNPTTFYSTSMHAITEAMSR